jgi:hypothetical protein
MGAAIKSPRGKHAKAEALAEIADYFPDHMIGEGLDSC